MSKKVGILSHSVPRRRVGVVHALLGLFLMALGASCGETESNPSAENGSGTAGQGQAPADDDDDVTSSGGKQGNATGGNTGNPGTGGKSGTAPIDHPDYGGSGGSAPPAYECIPSDVLHPPSTAVGLNSDVHDLQLDIDDDGNRYLGGAVYGNYSVRVLGEQLPPPGYLVLAKLDAGGRKIWSKRFGSEEKDQADHFASLALAPSGELWVSANLSTRGRDVDDPNEWGEHRLMLARFAADGTELVNVTYPAPFDTAIQGLRAVGDQVYVWGTMLSSFELGGLTLAGSEKPHGFFAQLDAQGVAVSAVELSDEGIEGVAVSPTGQLLAHLQRFDGVARSLRVVALNGDLSVEWEAPFETSWTHNGDDYRFDVGRQPLLAVDGDTLLVASHFLTQGNSEDATLLDRFLIADGSSSRDVIFADGSDPVVQALRVLPDHSLVLGGVAGSGLKVGEQLLRADSGEGPFLMQLSPEGDPLWATMFCYDSSYGYSGDLRLGYAKRSLQALLIDAGVSELGKSFGELQDPLLLGFDLDADEPNGEGGRPAR